MTQKKLSHLSVFVVLFMGLVIAGWYFSDKQQQSLTATISGNYDTVMKYDKYGPNKKAPVDYYTLALSWSPAFCDLQKQRNDGNVPKNQLYQCGGFQEFGWVIHGLWPQNAKARRISEHPRFCKGDLAELPEATIEQYLPESPSATLLQGQWEKHGACAFDTADEYFAKQKELFLALSLPKFQLNKSELFKWMRNNNPQLNGAYMGASKSELFICYTKEWEPMDCPRNRYQ
ncbi:ribonuclease T [Pasteurellaceae bacterium RH1A]|nr:ribonuclease T [Pasteurellaceae bacterium RH1A]